MKPPGFYTPLSQTTICCPRSSLDAGIREPCRLLYFQLPGGDLNCLLLCWTRAALCIYWILRRNGAPVAPSWVLFIYLFFFAESPLQNLMLLYGSLKKIDKILLLFMLRWFLCFSVRTLCDKLCAWPAEFLRSERFMSKAQFKCNFSDLCAQRYRSLLGCDGFIFPPLSLNTDCGINA